MCVGITTGLLPDLDLVVVGMLQLALQRRASFRTYYVAGGFRHCLVGHTVLLFVFPGGSGIGPETVLQSACPCFCGGETWPYD